MDSPAFYHSIVVAVTSSSTADKMLALLVIFTCYQVALIVYRLVFHPLAGIPGPKLPAISALPAMYHDIIRGGQYVWVIEEWHRQYGPIIRIRPNTVHINDPLFMDDLFPTTGKRRHKSHLACNSFGNPLGSVATFDHELHRRRRAATAPYFSMSSIRRLEPIILTSLSKVLSILRQSASIPEGEAKPKVINPNLLFSAATADIITEYGFGDSWNNLEMEGWNETFFNFVKEGTKMWHVNSYFPFVMRGLLAMPVSWSTKMVPEMAHVLRFFGLLDTDLAKLKKQGGSEKESVFNALLNPSLPASERSDERLLCEAKVLLAAGTDTTALTLTKVLFHVLNNKNILGKLKKELKNAIPDDSQELPNLTQVEGLPYLNAIIHEALRLHPAGTMRQERIAPDEDLFYTPPGSKTEYRLPAGSIICMTGPLIARLEEYYTNPLEFNPERFFAKKVTPSGEEKSELVLGGDKYALAFGRGSRMCLGINLAWMELRLFISGLFRRYGVYDEDSKDNTFTMELVNTTKEDVDMAADFGIPFIKEGREGVKIRVY